MKDTKRTKAVKDGDKKMGTGKRSIQMHLTQRRQVRKKMIGTGKLSDIVGTGKMKRKTLN